MTAREVFEETKSYLSRPAQYLVLPADGQGPEDRERVFAVVLSVCNGCPECVEGVWPVEDDFLSTRAYFRLAAWCDRQGEFIFE